VRRLAFALVLTAACALPAAPLASGAWPFVATLAPDGPPRGVVIGIHGGAWYGVGRELSLTVRDDLERWRRQGWRGVIVDYAPGGDAPASVLRSYDRVRARYGPDLPICLYGESAGGHLALLVAAARPDVACVETAGAPTDLAAIDPRPSALAAHADRNARRAFPGRALETLSPVRHAADIHARLLLTHLRTDPVIGVGHSERMAAAARRARLVMLEPGPVGWVHRGVSKDSFASLDRAERDLMAAVAQANGGH
jgi:acetyl esterase/lipase